jgi:4-amino-4-deoxy-L-arabinose transferase-like glycosyltransferase
MANKRFRENSIFILVSIAFLFGAFLLILVRSMENDYNRDENQFIASAYLFVKQGLLPYVDYPYFHMPNLVFLYAGLFKLSSHKLLIARFFSAICASLVLIILYGATCWLYRKRSLLTRLIAAVSASLLLLANVMFQYTSGQAWNHDLPVLLTLAATILLFVGTQRAHTSRYFFLSGVLLGLAIGTRATFAPLILPFAGAAFFAGQAAGWQHISRLLAAFILGGIISMLPSLALFGMAPAEFIFGNLRYAGLNTLYYQNANYDLAMSLSGKFSFLSTILIKEPSMILLVLLVVFLVYAAGLFPVFSRKRPSRLTLFIMVLIPFMLVGSFLPTPSFPQYFYAPIPFAILAIMDQTSRLTDRQEDASLANWALALVVVVVLLSGLYGLVDFPKIFTIKRTMAYWFPLQAHSTGEKIAALVEPGKMLTLTPILVAEANWDFYPEFVSGPFAWRTAHLLTTDERQRFNMVASADLPTFLSQDQPQGILVGWEPDLEEAIVKYAKKSGFSPSRVAGNLYLWLP